VAGEAMPRSPAEDYARLPLKDWTFAVAFLRIARLGHGRDVRFPRNLLPR
jgi:ubiquinone biosynthesis protein